MRAGALSLAVPSLYVGAMAWLWLALAGLPTGVALEVIARRLVSPAGEEGTPADEGVGDGAFIDPSKRAGAAQLLLMVAATAALFGIAGWRFDRAGDLAMVAAYISVLVLCAATDLLSFKVPNAVTYPAILGALALGFAMPGASAREVLAGGAVAGGILLVPALLTGGRGFGIGDAKLAAFAGLALGLPNVAAALLFTALLGGMVATMLLVTGVCRRHEPIPYAPFVSAGALIALLWRGPAFAQLS